MSGQAERVLVFLPGLEAEVPFLQGHAPRPVAASEALRAAATIGVSVDCGISSMDTFGP